jgi:hypothetical protein
MRMVIGVIVGISFAVLVLLGIIALVCWHKYNNTKEQDILKKYAKLLHQLEYLLYFDLLISLISVMVYASSVFK